MTKKIDGRKAVVIDWGKGFTTYNSFARKHGYPEAAADSDLDDKRVPPKEGDTVTLLISGSHEMSYYKFPLWIVETANGERHIIAENGLRIIENETEGDESMENVIEIDGVKYREVKRKAAVGEKVKVTVEYSMGEKIGGRVLTVIGYDFGLIDTDGFWNDGSVLNLNDRDYVVLEPITADASPDDSDAEREIVDLIALQRELNGLKRQQAELTKQVSDLAAQADGLTDAFAKLVTKTAAPLPLPEIRRKTAQERRNEIVKQAKQDVAELSTTAINNDVIPTLDGDVEAFFPGETDYVDFIVNRDKRTVVALIRYIDEKDVWAKGIAKAAPGDVFNSHIGRAIALRRALGLEVPTEYTNAPQPTEPRVGDVVENTTEPAGYVTVKKVLSDGSVRFSSYEDDDGEEVVGYAAGYFRIVDDSREEVSE